MHPLPALQKLAVIAQATLNLSITCAIDTIGYGIIRTDLISLRARSKLAPMLTSNLPDLQKQAVKLDVKRSHFKPLPRRTLNIVG